MGASNIDISEKGKPQMSFGTLGTRARLHALGERDSLMRIDSEKLLFRRNSEDFIDRDDYFEKTELLRYYESLSEKLFKIIVVGEPTVGKTAFVQRYVCNSFRSDFKATVGVDFSLKILPYSNRHTIKLQLWDIAGQERFSWMTRVYYKDAHGCVIIFDLTNRNSFLHSLKWKEDVDSKCILPNGSPIPCILLANKCDLPNRQIDQMEIESFARENNFIGWTEVSAKEGLMVFDSMKFLVDTMINNDSVSVYARDDATPPLQLNRNGTEGRKKSCFC